MLVLCVRVRASPQLARASMARICLKGGGIGGRRKEQERGEMATGKDGGERERAQRVRAANSGEGSKKRGKGRIAKTNERVGKKRAEAENCQSKCVGERWAAA